VSLINTISVLLCPLLAILVAARFKNKLNSRDGSILYISFFIAMVCVIPALVIKNTAAELGYAERNVSTLFGKIGFASFTAFVDELNKYIVIIAFAYRKKEYDEPLAGILVTIMIALGFLTIDNAWHIMQGDKFSDTWRMITVIPVGIAIAIIMGFYSGLSKYGLDSDDLSSFGLRLRGLLAATFFHAFYNFFLFMEEYKSLTTVIIIGLILLTFQVGSNLFRAIRLHKRLAYSRKKRTRSSSSSDF
jgi:RsiW-degrading membrane proteinase PrsW (M82 family)